MICTFNLDHFPIVYMKLNDNEINDNSFEEYKEYYLNLLLRCKKENQKLVLICNLDNTPTLPMNYIIKQSQFNKDIYKHNQAHVKTVCILCKNKSFKNILNLYFSVSKPANPFKICRSFMKVNIYLSEKFKMLFDTHIFSDDTEQCAEQCAEQEEEEDIIQSDKESDKQENNDESPKSIQSIEQIL